MKSVDKPSVAEGKVDKWNVFSPQNLISDLSDSDVIQNVMIKFTAAL